mmetsp:Transcript_163562/g.524453  ORF Transcript_163562/g.524453 Transcript_163562/m.524453 type:complete len:107 (-) Transcript_163562:270-590(-)
MSLGDAVVASSGFAFRLQQHGQQMRPMKMQGQHKRLKRQMKGRQSLAKQRRQYDFGFESEPLRAEYEVSSMPTGRSRESVAASPIPDGRTFDSGSSWVLTMALKET